MNIFYILKYNDKKKSIYILMVDSISEEHLLEYQKILYDISANIIFNPYNEYDLNKNNN